MANLSGSPHRRNVEFILAAAEVASIRLSVSVDPSDDLAHLAI